MTFAPLDREPVNVRPPFDERPPAIPHGTDTDKWRAAVRADRAAALTEALNGVELGTQDRSLIDWLAGWDTPTVGTLVSLIYRAREAETR